MLREKIIQKKPGIVTYGLTPPKQNNPPEKLTEISQRQIERIKPLELDALVLYDIQDEADRNRDDRPFPFISTVDPAYYSEYYLKEIPLPKIIYRCVGKYTPQELEAWLDSDPKKDIYSVFVGAASSSQVTKQSLQEAYKLTLGKSGLFLGGVAIPERHIKKNNEHLRIIDKLSKGCSYFISQVTYNVEVSKNFLSDYYYTCRENGIEMTPILFTLTPCGSLQTLEFMKWLGISIPKWLENDLKHSEDILEKSLDLSKQVFKELLEFSLEKGIPMGCNIESLSVRKLEIEASVQLVRDIQSIFRSYLGA